jgi:hypothetical protein
VGDQHANLRGFFGVSIPATSLKVMMHSSLQVELHLSCANLHKTDTMRYWMICDWYSKRDCAGSAGAEINLDVLVFCLHPCSDSDPMAILYEKVNGVWKEVGRTEPQTNTHSRYNLDGGRMV